MKNFPGELYAIGSTGSNVRAIQNALNDLNFNVGNADGIYGEGTANGVKEFQRANNLNPDGIVGKLTWDKLFNDNGASANHPFSGDLLSMGSTGPNVELVQQRLNELGYNAGVVDGIYGSGTRQAVIDFQGDHFISTDGIVGEVTWSILFNGTANGIYATYPGYVLSVGSQGDSVKIIQNQLNRLGFNVGSADGIFGSGTESGVKDYQESRNLVVDGIVGPNTWDKLMSDSQTGENVNNNTPFPGVLLSRGSTGSYVRMVQRRLNQLNFFVGSVDGIYGPKTEQRVKDYQASKELQVDGIVGRLTWDAMFNNTTANVRIPYPGTLLTIGSAGDNVARVQSQLNTMGYNAGAEDGIFGDNTASAVRRFQLANNLEVDGIVGRNTWNALFNGDRMPAPDRTETSYPNRLIREGDTGSLVRQVQQKLNDRGYSSGTVDGIFGPMTRRAVEAYQHANGLDVDGIVGRMTWNSLFSISHPGNNDGDQSDNEPIGNIRKIYIDPGHGGYDPGARRYGLEEKDLVLDISLRQRRLLEAEGYIVKMSRETDIYRTLPERTNEANQWGADLFISNHVNAGGGIGAEVYHSIYGGPGKRLAEKIMDNLSPAIFVNRGAKSRQGQNGDYYHVIREANMPSVLIEHGFIDTQHDVQILQSPSQRQNMAEKTVDAIKSLFHARKDIEVTPQSPFSDLFNVSDKLRDISSVQPGIKVTKRIAGVQFTYEAFLEAENSVNWSITDTGFPIEDLMNAFANKGLKEINNYVTTSEDSIAVWIENHLLNKGIIEEVRFSVGEVETNWNMKSFTIKPCKFEMLLDVGDGLKIREVLTMEKDIDLSDTFLANLSPAEIFLFAGFALLVFICLSMGSVGLGPIIGATGILFVVIIGGSYIEDAIV
ncbi:N-acetylmuramoyl-L-alanine amidase [Gracilibacillus saliphilus]|uniref:N-acetylmuramoyl-L-alanine amidase n=1 Tax=Gracilibacillus saliphilus TaxID=543890 RepID=UPI0013D20ED9|nr:peptidoglycan-binding protein [Gracilibacillus saliphilus]